MASFLAVMLAGVARLHAEERDPVTLSARESGGFGRLEFGFREPAGVTARIAGSVLIVTFDRAVALNPEKLASALPGYLAAVRLDPDFRSMRFALTRPVRIDVKEAAERVFLDLLPSDWTGPPPPLPSEVVRDLARRARDAQKAVIAAEQRTARPPRREVAISLASREDGDRIILELTDATEVQLSQADAALRVQLPASAALDSQIVRARLADIARDVRVDSLPEGPVLWLTLKEARSARLLHEDGVAMIDLSSAAVVKQISGGEPKPAEAPAGVQPEIVPVVPQTVSPPAANVSPPVISRTDAKTVDSPAIPEAVPTHVTIASRDGGVRVSVKPRVPAAVFQRGGEVWVVLQRVRSLRLPTPGSAERALLKSLASAETPGAVLLRLTPEAVSQVSVSAELEGWSIDLGPEVALRAQPVHLRRSVAEDGRRQLKGSLPGAGEATWIDDPDSGERLAIGPMTGAPHAVLAPQSFAEAHFSATALGIAVVARADDLILQTGLDGFTLRRGEGLSLSQDTTAAHSEQGDASLVVDAQTWVEDRRGAVREAGRTLLNAAADAAKRDRTAARLRYARFLLANGLGSEARGVLTLAASDDPVAGQGKAVMLLRVLAALQADDVGEAARLLAQPSLALEAEGILWRAVLDARNRRFGPALAGFRQSQETLDRYPDSLQALIRPLVVQSALEGGDTYLASQQAGELERLDAGERESGLVPLLQGRIAEASGRDGEALQAYRIASTSPVRPIEAEARLSRALLLLRTQPAEQERMVAELETIAMIWRRGDVEVIARAKLSELYAAQARWRDAFAMTKRAIEIQPEHPVTRRLQDDTTRRFEALFLEGHDGKLSRVEALAIFDDFRSLLPPGPRGDEIVRRLADRLFELDLLDQAAELLAHQVEHRLKGVARSQVAARLAVVHLVNGKPQEALKVLRATRLAALPGDLRRARVLLEARTLAELSRTELAIEVLAAETGPDVERLRADIYWRGKRWQEAGESYERALADRNSADQPLEPAERGDAVRAAVAYVLAGDRLGVDRFRTKFLAKMSDSPDAETFRLVTLDNISRADAFRETARNVVSAQTLGDFLDAYRKRYPEAAGSKREAGG